MEASTIIFILLASFVIGYAIFKAIQHDKKKSKNKVWKHSPMIFIKGSRQEAIFNLLNIEVVKRGRKPYKADYNISMKALDRVLEMDLSGIMDHSESHDELNSLQIEGSDGSADLVSKYYRTSKRVVGKESTKEKDGYGWFGSEKHKAAIMNPKYDYCGIGSLLRENRRWIDDLMLVDEKTVN